MNNQARHPQTISSCMVPPAANNQSEVQRELDALFGACGRLDEVVSMLAERLNPVKGCYPPETNGDGSCSPATASVVGGQINTAQGRIHQACQALLREIDLLAI